MKAIFSQFQKVAFSGSRSCPGAIAAVSEVLPLVAPGATVSVGCAKGVDMAVRKAFPNCQIFKAADFAGMLPEVPYKAVLAIRSAACINSVAPAGLVVVCPQSGRFCSKEVVPSKNWSGGGSGSWASAAYALGMGCTVILWVSPGVETALPVWVWRARQESYPCAAGGYWVLLEQPAQPVQASMF